MKKLFLPCLILFCANTFAQNKPLDAQSLLGDILIYKGYQAAGDHREKIFGCLSSAGISGGSFLENVKRLSLDEQTRLYLIGKILIGLDGEAAMSFREAFSHRRKEIKKRLNLLSHDDLISIFRAYRIPSSNWMKLEKQIRSVK